MRRRDSCGQFSPIVRYCGLDLCGTCLLPAIDGVTRQLVERHGRRPALAMRGAPLPRLGVEGRR